MRFADQQARRRRGRPERQLEAAARRPRLRREDAAVKRVFRHLPIRLKLIATIMTTCAAVVVLASLGYLLIDYYQTRGELERDLHAQAELILQNSVARARVRRHRGRARDAQHPGLEAEYPRSPACTSATITCFAAYRQAGETGRVPAAGAVRGHPLRIAIRPAGPRRRDDGKRSARSCCAPIWRRWRGAAGSQLRDCRPACWCSRSASRC